MGMEEAVNVNETKKPIIETYQSHAIISMKYIISHIRENDVWAFGALLISKRLIRDEYISKPLASLIDMSMKQSMFQDTPVIKIEEHWKDALDDKMIVGAMLVDMIKALDCLTYRLLPVILHAYGLWAVVIKWYHT